MSNERWRMRRTTRRQLVAGGLAMATPLGLGSLWPARYLGRLYPGAAVLGLDLGGLTRAEASARIEQRLRPFLAAPVTFRLAERTWTATAADLGLRINVDETLDHACRHGRRSILRRYATLLDPVGARAGTPVVVELDDGALRAVLDALDRDIAREPRDARLTAGEDGVVVSAERPGRRLDHPAMREAVLTVAASLTPAEIAVVTVPVAPRTTAADLVGSEMVAATIVGAPVTVWYGDRTWEVTRGTLAKLLVVPDDPERAPSLDREALAAWLAPIGDEINHPPQDATVAWDGGLYATSGSFDGVAVDLETLAAAVSAAALTNERWVELPLVYLPPAVDADNLDALGIVRRIAVGSSSFMGSSEARATNVRVAAEHVSQALIPPGGTLSFNDALGPITPEQGYVQGKVISGNWYTDDLGGGVCQVSTTVFRAALLAGLPFDEWHPHSFRLAFYELDGWPPGMDAAIYQPNTPDEWELDLVFRNLTDAWMLLQLRIDAETVAAELYGPETGCDVALSDPAIGEPIPPPDALERESADLADGERQRAQTAQPGIEVVLTRTVRRAGEPVREETFASRYDPQPEVWLVGSGA